MGKKRIEKMTRLVNNNTRKVTLCKRKKGVIKKLIELSVLCDLKIFMLIQDDANNRATHFLSHKNFDLVQSFNEFNHREFFTNGDYERVGGVKEELDSDFKLSELDADSANSDIDEEFQKLKDNANKIRSFSRKRKN